MNILLLAPQPFYQERGTPIAVRLLAQTLGEMGHRIHLLVFAEGQDITIPNVTIHRHISVPGISNIKPGFSFRKLVCDVFLFVKCIKLVRKYNFDLIHAVEESVFIAMAMKKLFKIPYVYDMDSCMSEQLADKFPIPGPVVRLMAGWEKAAMVQSAGIVAVCRSLENAAREQAPGVPLARLEDISLLGDNVEGDEDLREKLGIHGPVVLYVGNLEQYQGIDLLLAGFAEAVRRNDKLSLILIGGRSSDIEKYRLLAEKSGIAAKVFFCGPRPVEMLGYYLHQADILISPRSQGKNTPMKIYSYLDSGIPLLATNLPTHTQVLDDTIACLVEPTPEKMAAGIITLAENMDYRNYLSRNAEQRVRDEYSLPAFRRKLETFYRNVSSELSP